MIAREEALTLISSFQPEAQMVQHALASEAVMRVMASHFSEDAELWGMAGLLHDVDYPMTKDEPDKHGVKAMEILVDLLPEEALYAIKAHNSECTGQEPLSRLDYALRAGETITGLITAAALMRPTGMEGMEVRSIKKKMKDKAFAAAVNRERIRECEKVGLTLDEFISLAIQGMTPLSHVAK